MMELKITKKQEELISKILQSYEFFPELALDEYSSKDFHNSLYTPNTQTIMDLLERDIIRRDKKTLFIPKLVAKDNWDRLVKLVPQPSNSKINLELLESKTIEELKKVYFLYTGKKDLNNKQDLIDKILEIESQPLRRVKNMTEEKKVKQTGKSVKEVAWENKLSPAVLRKVVRSLYGKSQEGNWSLSPDMVKKVLVAYQEKLKKAKENRMANLERLKKAREAKAAKKTNKE